MCHPRRSIAGLVLLLGIALPASADEVNWRYDYNAARQEAVKLGRPLLLEFSTEWCGPCRKLEATTFHDPVIVRTLNEQFIPVKLDGKRESKLADALKVQGFPTLIMAGQDGKILQTVEGYIDAGRLREHLQVVLAAAANPEWMTKAYQDALRAAAGGDWGRALALLKTVVEDNQNRPVQQQARNIIQDIETQARAKLMRVRQNEDRGQYLEAVDGLTDLIRSYSGTQAAAEAAQSLTVLADKPEVKTQQRRQRAAKLLSQAKADFQTKQYLCCLDRCTALSSSYGDLPEGAEAVQLLEQIKSNPEWLKEACATMTERLAEMYLAQAEAWLKKGQTELAASCLERVANMLPGTRYAEMAKVRLAQVQGRPATHQAGYK